MSNVLPVYASGLNIVFCSKIVNKFWSFFKICKQIVEFCLFFPEYFVEIILLRSNANTTFLM